MGLEGSCTPALARLVCLEGADEASYQKAQEHLKETGGIAVSARPDQGHPIRDPNSTTYVSTMGPIEESIIGARCKQSGMFWGVPGAENILALRCVSTSRRLAEFWKVRLNAHAARNDYLALAA